MVLFESCIAGMRQNNEEFSKKGEKLWKEFKQEYEPTIVEYNLIIQIYALSKQMDKAFEIWNQMKSSNIASSQQTLEKKKKKKNNFFLDLGH